MIIKLRLTLLRLLPVAVLLVGWEVMARADTEAAFSLGSPSGIVREAGHLIEYGDLVHDFWLTLLETLLGFVSGTGLGTVIGLALWNSKNAYSMLQPYLVVLGALPLVALGPVLIFWCGTGLLSKVVLGFLCTVVVAITQAYNGAVATDESLLRMVRAFGGTPSQQFWRIVFPSAAVWVTSGVRLNVSMALLGTFVGEFIASRAGLGHLIIVAEGLYNVNVIWVGVIGILIIALFLHILFSPLEEWAAKMKPNQTNN